MLIEQYERLPDDGFRYELCEGESAVRPALTVAQSRSVIRIGKLLEQCAGNAGEVLVGAGFLLAEDPPTIREADVAFVTSDRIHDAGGDLYLRGAPDLAIDRK